MLVRQILTRPPILATSDQPIFAVSAMMRENDAGAVMILFDDQLIGIVTDRDIVTRAMAVGGAGCEGPISSVMTANPLTCFSDQPVVEAAVMMADHQVRRLPVVERDNAILGLLSVDLIAENFSEQLAGETLGEIVERRISLAPERTPRH